MPYRTTSWTLLRVREPGPWAHAVLAVMPFVIGALGLWIARDVNPLKTVAFALCFYVPFTALWIAPMVVYGRARLAFYVEGFVSGRRRPEAVSWNDVAAVRRAQSGHDAGSKIPPDWIIETRSGEEVYLEGWLVQPEVDLAPLRDRGFELPAS